MHLPVQLLISPCNFWSFASGSRILSLVFNSMPRNTNCLEGPSVLCCSIGTPSFWQHSWLVVLGNHSKTADLDIGHSTQVYYSARSYVPLFAAVFSSPDTLNLGPVEPDAETLCKTCQHIVTELNIWMQA